MNFHEFGLDPRIIEGIESIGFEQATPVQEQVIPPVIAGKDVIVSAQTGTGKTAAFLLPVLHRLISENSKHNATKVLIIVPTRELAIQIDQQMDGFTYFAPVSTIPVYGGGTGDLFAREQKALAEGTELVVCTPGRMIAHLNSGKVNFSELEFLILDEADRMLDMGFYDDIMKILSHIPQKRQTLMFSATMPPRIRELARKIMNAPQEITLANSKPPESIKQEAYVVHDHQKIQLIKHILSGKNLTSIIVFCSTKDKVRQLTRTLHSAHMNVEAIHSDLDQEERVAVLTQFKNRTLRILVATDILSRGIDIEDIDMVINFDVPHDGEDYVHRIGRTARAQSNGEAVTLIGEQDQGRFRKIEKLLGYDVVKATVPQELGEVPAYNPDAHRSFGRPHGKSNDRKGGFRRNSSRPGGRRPHTQKS